jgi:hypothetical protein
MKRTLKEEGMKAVITAKELEVAGACTDQVALFRKHFGEEVVVTEARARKVAALFGWDWAARQFLPATAWEAYEKARSTASEAYEKARSTAREAYWKEIATAWEAYEKARATAFAHCYIESRRKG